MNIHHYLTTQYDNMLYGQVPCPFSVVDIILIIIAADGHLSCSRCADCAVTMPTLRSQSPVVTLGFPVTKNNSSRKSKRGLLGETQSLGTKLGRSASLRVSRKEIAAYTNDITTTDERCHSNRTRRGSLAPADCNAQDICERPNKTKIVTG